MKNLSLAIRPEYREKLAKFAKMKGISIHKLATELIDKYLVEDTETIQVVLKIPVKLKGDRDNLKQWLETRSNAIVEALCKVEKTNV